MLKHVILLIFLCGILPGNSSGQEDESPESSDIEKTGIKKNEFGANGFESNSKEIMRNFRNPVLEYLIRSVKPDRKSARVAQRGITREILHSQTLLIPDVRSGLLSLSLSGPSTAIPYYWKRKPTASSSSSSSEVKKNLENFFHYAKSQPDAEEGGRKIQEKIVTSPALHLKGKSKFENRYEEELATETIQIYPATAFVINKFDRDGNLKSSVTHFQPDFNLSENKFKLKEAYEMVDLINSENYFDRNHRYGINSFLGDSRAISAHKLPLRSNVHRHQADPLRSFANYYPISGPKHPSDSYGSFLPSMYSAVSSLVEYGRETEEIDRDESQGRSKVIYQKNRTSTESKGGQLNAEIDNERDYFATIKTVAGFTIPGRRENDENLFGEVTLRSDIIKTTEKKSADDRQDSKKDGNTKEYFRNRRDTTSLHLKTSQGDKIDITLEEPKQTNTKQRKPGESALILRKGGIAIAGPGGAATAYTGGTAIVGPYGTVYKSPRGTAIVGPFSRIVDITDDTSFEEIVRMHEKMQNRVSSPLPRFEEPVRISLKNYKNFFSYNTDLPVKIELKSRPTNLSGINWPRLTRPKEEEVRNRSEDFSRAGLEAKETETTLIFQPKSIAEAGKKGIALSAPTSHAILYPGQKAQIYFEPESVANAGPSGFAHAQSDLIVTYLHANNKTTLEEINAHSRHKNRR